MKRYTVIKLDHHIEVRFDGVLSPMDIPKAVCDVLDLSPRKEIPDVWVFSSDCIVPPLDSFATMAGYTKRILPPDVLPTRTAIVVGTLFQKAQMETYVRVAHSLPYEMHVFVDRSVALEWVMEKPASA